MDLAEIRKKARVQNANTPEDVPLSGVRPEEAETALDFPLTLADDDQFWLEMGTEQFATEDEYSQGLAGSDKDDEAEQAQWLGFYLGNEEYALDLEVVSELIKPRALTELPQVADYICGIITLRGEVIPVVDLKIRLGLGHMERCDADSKRIVVCEGKDQRIGLLVDKISQVVRMPLEAIETPQLVGDNPAIDFIQGIGRKQGKMLIQLQPEKIMKIEAGTD